MADETQGTVQQKLDAEIAKLKAEERKIESERIKLEFEHEEFKRESAKRWYRRQTFQRFLIAIVLGAPLAGFYLNYIIIPVTQADMINSRLENAETKDSLDKQVRYNDSLRKEIELQLKIITDLRSTQKSLDSAHLITKNLLAQTLVDYNKSLEQLRMVSASIPTTQTVLKGKLNKEIDRGARFETKASSFWFGTQKVIDSLNTTKRVTEEQLIRNATPAAE